MRFSVLAAILTTLALLSGCGDEQPAAQKSQSPAPTSPSASATPSASAMEGWAAAAAFLKRQKRAPEIVCQYTSTTGPVEFYSFDAQGPKWRPYLASRHDPDFKKRTRICTVNVPTSVPYTEAGIEGFLNPMGFRFMSDPHDKRLKAVEISYAGANADDPDMVFANTPGLWGAKMALGRAKGVDFSHGFPLPRDEKQAAAFLKATAPLLKWYDYPGA